MSVWASLLATSGPAAAVEFAQNHVSGAVVEHHGRGAVIRAHAVETLPEGALVASLTASNVRDRAAVGGALQRVLEQLDRPHRLAIVVPDPVAKVSLVKFEEVPANAQDFDQLVRWQVRKSAPFPIDEAQVSFVPGHKGAGEQEFIVTLARRDVVQEYEGMCAAAGAHAGIVDLATFNVVNAVLAAAAPSGDWLLVNAAPDYATIVILRGHDVIFFRNRSAEADGTLVDLVHQTAMYYEDRLSGSGFSRVLLAGAASAGPNHEAAVEELGRSLELRLSTRIEAVDPRGAAQLSDRISAAPALLDALTPLVGVLLRGEAA